MMPKTIYSFLFLIAAWHLSAQDDGILLEDYVYVTNIKSVTFHPTGDLLDPPIVYLGNRQRLQLSFDDMENNIKDYTYEIRHCNKDWTAYSSLERLEYLDGFIDEEIDNSNFSINTFVPYINYVMALPNDDLTWLLSGNYLLIVYEGNDIDDRIPVITRRFMVVDKKVNIFKNDRRPLDVSKLRTHYEFDLFVNHKDFPIVDPRSSVWVTVMQNYRADNAIENLQPKFNVGDQLTIDNTGKISFPAIKEFRPIDIRSLDYTGNGINSIELRSYGTDVLLDLGKPRTDAHYLTTADANGRFVIQNRDQGSDRLQGDYANVIFTLESPELEQDVYVTGGFTDWKPDEMYRMRYYEERGVYVAEVQLKQGYYDYFFAVEENGKLDPTAIEGSWADTANQYQVLVYLREPADRYDRLVGFYTFDSNSF